MLARIGNVVYWAMCAGAALMLVGGTTSILRAEDTTDQWLLVAGAAFFAFLIWLAGRAVLYVLAGR